MMEHREAFLSVVKDYCRRNESEYIPLNTFDKLTNKRVGISNPRAMRAFIDLIWEGEIDPQIVDGKKRIYEGRR